MPTYEMYELTKEAYHPTQKLFDIDGGSERFEKNVPRLLNSQKTLNFVQKNLKG